MGILRVTFSDSVIVHSMYSSMEYDRKGDNTIQDIKGNVHEITRIYTQLKNYKLYEMQVHTDCVIGFTYAL